MSIKLLHRPSSDQVNKSNGTNSTEMNRKNASSSGVKEQLTSPPLSRSKRKKKPKATTKLLWAIGSITALVAIVNHVNSLVHHGFLPFGITLIVSTEDSESKWHLGGNSEKHTEEESVEEMHYLPPPRKLKGKKGKLQQKQQQVHNQLGQMEKGPLAQRVGKGKKKTSTIYQGDHEPKARKGGPKPAVQNGIQLQVQKEKAKGEVHNMQYYIAHSRKHGDDKERILNLLRDNAGIRMLSQPSYDALPSWSQVTSMYGDRPRLLGLDQCEAFQGTGDLADKFLAVAGAFNSGTNFLAKLLTRNCVLHKRQAKYGVKQRGIRWQVPYGKHTPPLDDEFRNRHVAAKSDGVTAAQVLPAVMIRDPFRWLQSMCSHHYTSRWPRVFSRGDPRYHCPNLFPLTEEKDKLKELEMEPILERSNTDLKAMFDTLNSSKAREKALFVGIRPDAKGKHEHTGDVPHQENDNPDDDKFKHDTEDDKAHHLQADEEALTLEELDRHYFPVRIKYSNFTREHRSLVHFYNEWYQEYLDLKDYPHLMVRMEDLLFFPDQVVPQICACAGGQSVFANRTTPDGKIPVRVVAQSAKAKHSTKFMEEGEEHTGYLDALIKYGTSDTRFRGMTAHDLQYAGRHLNADLMDMFGYDYPDRAPRAEGG